MAESVLLYDADCGFCSRIVRFVLRHEKQKTLLFAPMQSAYARRLLNSQPAMAELDSVFWVDLSTPQSAQRILARSAAVLRLCAYLGGWWTLLRLAWVVPRPIRDAVYDVIAMNRHRFVADRNCLFGPSDSSRFVDNRS